MLICIVRVRPSPVKSVHRRRPPRVMQRDPDAPQDRHAPRGVGAPAGRLAPLLEMTQPRITGLVAATAAAGFLIGAGGGTDPARLVPLLIGTVLACGGTNALNQWLERDRDARMDRTRARPIPAGRVGAGAGLAWGTALAAAGTGLLWAGVGPLVGGLSALTVLSYLLLYTPLKARTPWSTHLGTLPGALPVLGGWVAATGGVEPTGWALFGMLLAWQLPHFFALEWLHREDYRAGGFATLAVADPSGRRSGRHALLWAGLLLAVSLVPLADGRLGLLYAGGAVAAGLALLLPAAAFRLERSARHARRLFLASLLYLPVALGAGVADALL